MLNIDWTSLLLGRVHVPQTGGGKVDVRTEGNDVEADGERTVGILGGGVDEAQVHLFGSVNLAK